MYLSTGEEFILWTNLTEAGIEGWRVDSASILQLNQTIQIGHCGKECVSLFVESSKSIVLSALFRRSVVFDGLPVADEVSREFYVIIADDPERCRLGTCET